MAHRSASLRPMYPLSQRSPLYLRTTIVHARPSQIYQARQLWWWSSKRHIEYPIDDEQERFLRQQKHIRNRYAKIIRRQAMWDRDPSPSPWPWQRRRSERLFQDRHNLSSSEGLRNRDHKDREDTMHYDLKTFHKDFDSFRKAVDRAMDRDPYGTLFGRRLWSPPSANNSSWTSFSWIFDPKEIKEENADVSKTAQATQPSSKPNRTSETLRSAPKQPPETPTPIAAALPTTDTSTTVSQSPEYEYDPISVRKVPKHASSAFSAPQPENRPVKPAETPRKEPASESLVNTTTKQSAFDVAEDSAFEPRHKTIFETLFAENAVGIPVKTYSPKVYGYNTKSAGEESPEKKAPTGRFETSRKREFQVLKAATLGNTIDTTAEFFGKYNTDPVAPATSQEGNAAANGDVALFSGTTYEGKVDKIVCRSQDKPANDESLGRPAEVSSMTKSAWLEQEGFTTSLRETPRKGFNQISSAKVHETAHDIPIKKYTGVEPSLTSLNSQRHVKADRLQPSLDRPGKDIATSEASSRSAWENKIAAAEKAEDIDLLRTSDIRASMKAGRTTKHDIERQKEQTRERLEKDFMARRVESEQVQPPKYNSFTGLDHIWKHVEDNKDGIVARTIRSMSVFNDNFKKYVRPENDLNNPSPASTESDVKTPTIYKPSKPLCVPTAPSKQLVDALQEGSEPITALQHTTAANRTRIALENEKLDKLAKEIKLIYEQQYGKVDQAQTPAETRKPHPLSTASVKEGVSRDPVIDAHIRKFEPAFARLVDEMKDVRRNLHEAKLSIKDLRTSMSKKTWSELESARLSEYATERLVEEDMSASGLDEGFFAEVKKPSEVDAKVLDQPVAKVEPTKRDTDPKGLDEPVAAYPATVDPRSNMAADLDVQADSPRIEAPVFTLAGSPIWNDEQPPPISELKAAMSEFKSPFVILVYDSSSKAVKAISSPNLPTLTPRDNLNAFSLLAGLDVSQAANFLSYFPRLQNAGYELVDGDKDKLIFHNSTQTMSSAQSASPKKLVSDTTKEAATVLNEIPAEIDPPGPSAPIPPPSSYPTSPVRPRRREPRVRRQEPVFSGTATAPSILIEPLAKQSATAPPSPPPASDPSYDYATQTPKPGFFNRVTRAVRRMTLTVLALAGGAYTIGFIAEGIGAREQAHKGINQADLTGPRKKIVLPQVLEAPENLSRGTRPGIYSTESSRRE